MAASCIFVERQEKLEILRRVCPEVKSLIVVPSDPVRVRMVAGDLLFSPQPSFLALLRQHLSTTTPEILLAFDGDEAGHYLTWLVYHGILQLSKGTVRCQRLVLAALDGSECGLVLPVNSGQGERFYYEKAFHGCLAPHLRRLLGTSEGPGGISLTVDVLALLALVAERDQGIRAGPGQDQWQLTVSLDLEGEEVAARLMAAGGAAVFEEEAAAQKMADELAGQMFLLESRQGKDFEVAPPQPCDLIGLVADAGRFFQMPIPVALLAVRHLYEGVQVNGRSQALVSSPWSDSVGALAPVLIRLQDFVKGHHGVTPAEPQEALPGILPLAPGLESAALSALPPAEQRIHDLVRQRAVASQLPVAKGKEESLVFGLDDYRLQVDSRFLVEQGFLAVASHGFESLLASAPLPEGRQARVVGSRVERMAVAAAGHYSLPELAADFADLQVGGLADLPALCGRLVAAGYLSQQPDATLGGTDTLIKIINILNRAFPAMPGLHFVGYYAQTLEEVASGRKGLDVALRQFDQNLTLQGKILVKKRQPPADVVLPKRKSSTIIKGGVIAETTGQQVILADLPSGAAGEGLLSPDPSVAEDQQELPSTPAAPESVGAEELSAPAENGVGMPGSAVVVQHGTDPSDGAAGFDPADGEPVEPEVLPGEASEGGEEQVPAEAVGESDAESHPDPGLQQSREPQEPASVPPPMASSTAGEDELLSPRRCPECQRPMVLKKDRFGSFLACTGLPACRHTEACQEGGGEGLLCPLCGQGRLVVKQTPTGKDMYVCSQHSCDFMAWSRPHAIPCGLCNSPFLVEKQDADGRILLHCPKAGCTYSQALAAESAQETPLRKKKMVVRRKATGVGGQGKRKVVVRRRKQ